jgi:hypothetical protein
MLAETQPVGGLTTEGMFRYALTIRGGLMTPKQESDMIRQSLWLNPETLAALKRIGAKSDRPVGWLLRKAAEEFVERQAKTR